MDYSIKNTEELTSLEINTILVHWDIPFWKEMTPEEFREKFNQSEFHLLTKDNSLLSVARINFDFTLTIDNVDYTFPELVGLVAIEKSKRYGSVLIEKLKSNLTDRGLEAIGFCEKSLRPFYEQCNVPILYGQAKYFREEDAGSWLIPDDDDILNISLSSLSAQLFGQLKEGNFAYIKS